MKVFALQLWREWREHRFALMLLAFVLPPVVVLLALQLPQGVRADPIFPAAVGLGFALVTLVGVGGEALGVERRGARWLERLPSGLAGAFDAKLVFTAVSLALLTSLGLGVGTWIASRHPGPEVSASRLIELRLELALLVAVLGLWTFATSAWAQRGGLALLAAALVLAVLGFPAWRLVEGGFVPSSDGVILLGVGLASTALVSAWLGFVRGGRLGHGPAFSALLGLAPTLPLLAGLLVWSSGKLAERDALDPQAADFWTREFHLTRDGRTAFVVGQHVRPDWRNEDAPLYALRIDLERGTHECLGPIIRFSERYHEDEHGRYLREAFEIDLGGREPLLFGAEDGEPRPWSVAPAYSERPRWKGLGRELRVIGGQPQVRDRFRGRDYPLARLGQDIQASRLLVRPGRWLVSPSPVRWDWLDPDTGVRTPTGWSEHSEPLVLLEDGRILLAETKLGLRWIQPETGLVTPIDSQGIPPEHLLESSAWRCLPFEPDGDAIEDDAIEDERVLLLTTESRWLLLEPGSTVARRVEVPDFVLFLRFVGAHEALVRSGQIGQTFARLDLDSGRLTPLWPPASATP